MANKPNKIIIHHDGVSRSGQSFDVINAYHKEKDFPLSELGFYVGYHYLIERNGFVRQAREDEEVGAHTVGQNDSSIGICLAGNGDEELPTDDQVLALGELLKVLTSKHAIGLTEIYPHRRYANKTCYGSLLSDYWGRAVLLSALVKPFTSLNPALGEACKKLLELTVTKPHNT